MTADKSHSHTVSTCVALDATVARLEGATGMVFLVSDFHWPLHNMHKILDRLSTTRVIPLVIWDKVEATPPDAGQLLSARDMQTGRAKTLWVTDNKRLTWLENVQRRRHELFKLFARHATVPFFLEEAFNAERLSRYFMEQVS